MSLREAYGAAVKAALRIIGFYIVFGVAVLLGLWVFMTRDDGWVLAGGALVVLGTVMTWLTVLAVIIKTSVDEATRRTARHIDDETARATSRIGGRSAKPAAPAGGGGMSWREAFGRAVLAALGIIFGIVACSICIALGIAAWAVGFGNYFSFYDSNTGLGALLMAIGAALVIFGVVMWILFPFIIVLGFSVKESTKRARRRIDDAVEIITNRLDARTADAGRAASESRAAAPPMPAGERPKSFEEAMRRRDADPPISERLSPFAEAARRRAAARTDPNETRTPP